MLMSISGPMVEWIHNFMVISDCTVWPTKLGQRTSAKTLRLALWFTQSLLATTKTITHQAVVEPSEAVAYLLQGLKCWMLRKAPLHDSGSTLLSELLLVFSTCLLALSSLTSLINNVFSPSETQCFFHPTLKSGECCTLKSQRTSSFSDTQATLSGI